MFGTIVLLGVIGLLTAYLLDVWKFRKYNALAELCGGPKGLPFFGVLFQLTTSRFLYEWPAFIRHKKLKSAYVRFGPFPTFYTQNPDIIEKIFSSPDCNVKAEMYIMLDKEMGTGLVTIGGPDWHHHRKSINPSFNHRVLMGFIPIFNQKASVFLKELDSYVGSGERVLKIPIQNVALKTTFATLLGKEFQDDDIKCIKMMEHFNRFWKLLLDRILNPHWRYDPIYRFTKPYESYMESKTHVMKVIHEVMDERLADVTRAKNHIRESSSNDEEIKKGNNIFLDQLLEVYQKQAFAWDDVFVEVGTMIFAGFETSATTIHSIIMFLAMYPEYQEKLFEEVVTLFPSKDFEVTYEDIKNLTYMDMVISETLRLATTIPIIGRVVTKDIRIADDLIIPTGTTVLMDLFHMHRSEDIWGPHAQQFNPNNFLPENLQGKHASYAPFAKGNRNCVGMRYANMFLKTLLAKVVRNFYFTTSFKFEDLNYVACITLNFVENPRIEVHRR